MERAKITNYEAFGKLVKDWAKNSKSRPADLEALKRQAEGAGAGLVVPPQYKHLQIIERDPETLYLVIPLAQMVAEAEDALSSEGAAYTLPQFYTDLFGSPVPPMTRDEMMKLHAERIADYTTGQCG